MASVAIGIITFKRPTGLRRLLQSLAPELAPTNCRVIVVDNDPAGSAEPVCAAFTSSLLIEYAIEARSGVSYARNRVLDLASKSDVLVFLDDDEWVTEGWLQSLLATSRRYPNAIVTGPVQYVLPSAAETWAERRGYFQVPFHRDDSIIQSTGAGNTLIPMHQLKQLQAPYFNTGYTNSGGEDHELFSRIAKAGNEIRWSSQARVYEDVPAERACDSWMRKRQIRSGFIRGRILYDERGRVFVTAQGLMRLLFGILLLPRGIKSRPHTELAKIHSGLGFIWAGLGGVIDEYGDYKGHQLPFLRKRVGAREDHGAGSRCN